MQSQRAACWWALAIAASLLVFGSCSEDPVAPSASPPAYRALVDLYPAWSPGGDAIAYRRGSYSSQGPPGVYVIHPDGTGNRLVLDLTPFYEVPLAILGEVRYSPDGLSLALALNGEVFILDLGDLSLRRLTYTGAKAFQPDWSPDGLHLVYRRRITSEFDSSGVYIVDVETGLERPLRFNGERVLGKQPRWSPRGEPIVLSSLVGGCRDIYAVHSDGTALNRLTNSGSRSFAEAPHWIDGGRRLLYAWRLSSDPASLQTRVMNADGSGQQQWPLTFELRTLMSDAISPDSKWVVVPGLPPNSTDSVAVLFVRGLADASGTTLRQLTSYSPPAGEHSPTTANP